MPVDPATSPTLGRAGRSRTSRTFWLAVSKSVAYGLILAVPLILVRRMSQEEYGTYLQAFQIITTAVALLPLGFGLTAFYFLPREPEVRDRVVANILLVLAVIGGLALAVFGLLPEAASRLTGNPTVSLYGPLIGLVIFFWVWSSFLENAVLANEEALLAPVIVVVSQAIRTGLLLAAALWAADLRSLLLASLAHGVVLSLVMLWYLSSRFPTFWRGFDPELLRRQVVYAAPYSLSALLWVLQTDLHAFFVSNGYGEEQFAVYRIAAFQLPFVALLAESVNAVMIPRVVELQRENNFDELRALVARVVRLLSIAFLPLFTALLVLNREFITGLFTMRYLESSPLFAVFLVLLPTNIVIFDSVARAFPALGNFQFYFRLFYLPALILGLWIGTRTLDLFGIAVLTVAFTLVERIVIAVRTAQTLHLRRADYYLMRDVWKVVVASLVGALATVTAKQFMGDVHPLIVFFGAGAVFYAVFVAVAFWLKLPTADERAMLDMWYRRFIARR